MVKKKTLEKDNYVADDISISLKRINKNNDVNNVKKSIEIINNEKNLLI